MIKVSCWLAPLLLLAGTAAAGKKPPKVFIDQGACPFECCSYGEWTVKMTTVIYDEVDGKKIIGTAKPGTKVFAQTGEVHTVPVKVKYHRPLGFTGGASPSGPLEDGETVWALTFQGEDYWKVWKDGEIITEVPLHLPDKKAPASTWWVKIRLPDGLTGWIKEAHNFGNKGDCGAPPTSSTETESTAVQ
jgi:hypothetical protein